MLAGDCTVVDGDDDREEHQGRMIAVVKPDNTVLVHDSEGYQLVVWPNRADTVSTCGRVAAPAVGDD